MEYNDFIPSPSTQNLNVTFTAFFLHGFLEYIYGSTGFLFRDTYYGHLTVSES